MDMKEEQMLEKLEEALERLSVRLDYEDLRKGEVNTTGGLFTFKGQRRVILHRGLSTKERADALAEILSRLDTEGIHLPEAVRKRIEADSGGPEPGRRPTDGPV